MENLGLINCPQHPGPMVLGYIVCPHVIGGCPVEVFEAATPESAGTACCKKCADAAEKEGSDSAVVETLKLCCEKCLVENGILRRA